MSTFGSGPVYENNSSPDSYVNPSEFFDFVDPDLIGQVLSDVSGVKYSVADMTGDGSVSNLRLKRILRVASGILESAALIGRRYSPESLKDLTTPPNGSTAVSASGEFLKCLVSWIGQYLCFSRRDGFMPPENVIFRYQDAEKYLERLKTGEAIFAFDATQEAGLPSSSIMTPLDLMLRNDLSVRWNRFYGTRQNMRRFPSGGW